MLAFLLLSLCAGVEGCLASQVRAYWDLFRRCWQPTHPPRPPRVLWPGLSIRIDVLVYLSIHLSTSLSTSLSIYPSISLSLVPDCPLSWLWRRLAPGASTGAATATCRRPLSPLFRADPGRTKQTKPGLDLSTQRYTKTPQCTSIKGPMVSIRWYLGCLKG